ncbi:helix-turn-helix domain-containing protein [Yoonia litorea]|uniref:Helix-turn-helix n=1 Tax=Yoonia litorea TaxID=1123755 RepID=A0A1I6LG06_9RHOB|nr:helix-turn-helix transcriptional regulator [Yoonia litorea]SFS02362.1 Helix-turn-helix [Yoonia litorea]
MVIKIDKRDRATVFRDRLRQAMEEMQVNQSALARATGVDRSTLSQLLKDQGARLPNGQLVAECASVLGVSTDWLLGLSDRPESATALLATAVAMTEAPRSMVDDQIFAWHQEAAGYKIRHVPAGLPDMLKTEAMLRWEYAPSLGRTIDQAIGAAQDRLNWMRSARSDYEIALPMSEVESFANGSGFYAGIAPALRRRELAHLRDLHAQLYPTLRLHLYDPRKLFSAPITVFGPLLAAIYIGRNYLVFRDTERVTALTVHFDQLVRDASISRRDLSTYLDGLISKIN